MASVLDTELHTYWVIEYYYCSIFHKCSYTAYDIFISLFSVFDIYLIYHCYATFVLKYFSGKDEEVKIQQLDWSISFLPIVIDNIAFGQWYFPSVIGGCMRKMWCRGTRMGITVMRIEIDRLEYIKIFSTDFLFCEIPR